MEEHIQKEPIEEDILEEKELWYRGPIRIILMIFLLLLLVLWYFPKESIKLDPHPENIPTIEEVLPSNFQLEDITIEINNKDDFYKYIRPYDPTIKQIADKIATISCDGNQVCQAKAIYYFVRNNIEYVPDPLRYEYVEDPKETLSTKAADCESGTILLASLLGAIGVDYELVFIPAHAFLRIKLNNALKKYQIGGWVYLDWTCSNCEFGEIPLNDKLHIEGPSK
ncbi:MAG: transglutaminase-like domain-containing protein [Nanoarchaeota archaeon]|nr:transglutaminase-like domain-containing protein [Nanoarchaeota archaeon]